MLSEMPRFNAARRYRLILLVIGTVFGIAGLALLEGAATQANIPWFPDVPIPRALGYVGAALWIAAAGYFSAAMMAFARQRCVAAEAAGKEQITTHRAALASSGRGRKWQAAVASLVSRVESWIPDAESLAEWPQGFVPIVFGLVAALQIVVIWRLPAEGSVDPLILKLIGGGLIVLAFPLLVLQRTYANVSADLLPEAPQIDRLLRVPLTACIGTAITMIMISAGFASAVQLERLISLLVFLVAVELILRSSVTLFIPFEPIEQRRAVADSSIAGVVLRLTPPNFRSMNITVRRQFGIDLSRSWALGFIQKAALPILVGIGVFAWLVTGVTALAINQRGVYERFGVPVAVFGPGLHVHFPWPMGVVRTVEIGVVHQLPIEFLLPSGSGQGPVEEKERTVAAEAPPPPSADRLWDDAHPFEGSYLIASEENGQQSFQLSDVDMAVVYQIGLTDEAARNAAYRVADPEAFIQALSGQILVRYLSQNTLLKLLGESRLTFSAEFQAALQKQLDNFSTGIQVLSISIEAIHPPPAAASAYHDVQAAEIRASTHVAESKGDAARMKKFAELEANGDRNGATAAGAELVGQAETASVLFGGDRLAYGKNGTVFLLERWFDNLTSALGKAEFIVIDHRLNGQDVPTLDLRNLETLSPAQSSPLPQSRPPAAEQPAQPDAAASDNDN
jgi:regulator of protease activity HflC (stomatin/prohibitin superfamily)